ncbi:Shprh, partial [Symbiodinium pilosum]
QQLSQELGLSDTQTQALPQEIKALREVGRTTSGLLKLCSHFCFSGASDVLTAEDECQKQLALRRERIRRTEREVKSQAERTASMAQLIRHFEPLFAKQPDEQTCPHICKEAKAALTARLKFLGKKAQGSKAELQSLLFETAAQCSSAVRSRALAAGFEAKTAGKMSHYQDTEAGGNAEAEWKKILAELAPQEPDADSGTLDVAARAVQGVLREAISALPRDPAPRCLKTRKHLGMPAWPSSGE